MMQDLLVYALVGLCAVYSVWLFLPASLKRRAAQALIARSPGLAASRWLQKMAQQTGGSGCDSCSNAPTKAVNEHKIQIFRRR